MLSTLLQEKMGNNKLSIRQAAAQIEVSHTTLIRALRNEQCDLATILKFSKWLEVEPNEILNYLGSDQSSLPNLIFLALNKAPKLAHEFEAVMQAIVDGRVNLDLIEDIAAYAAYRLKLATSVK